MFTKLSHKQESVTADSGYFYIPHRYRGEIKIYIIKQQIILKLTITDSRFWQSGTIVT
jgi:hypothetical protein